jgi:hypothetical protein
MLKVLSVTATISEDIEDDESKESCKKAVMTSMNKPAEIRNL